MQTRTPPHLTTMILLTGLAVLSLNMFLPSLPRMTVDLGASESTMALAVSGYMIVSGLLQLIMGPVSDRLGRRPVMVVAVSLYVAASLGCVLARDPALFLVFRMAQAVIITSTVLSAAIIRDQFPAREAASKMGVIGASMALAPMLGPTLGGILDTVIGWRAIFALYAALGAVALALVWVDLGETLKTGPRPLRASDYAALLRSGRFWGYAMCQAFSVGAFYVFIAGAPFVATRVWGLSPAWIGAGIGSITGGFLFGALATARLAPRLGLHRLILAGRIIPALGVTLGLLAFLAGFTSPLVLFGFTLTVGLGNGLTMANANTGVVSVRPDLAGTAASLSGALAVWGGAALTWITLLAVERSGTPVMLLSLILGSVLVSLVAGVMAIRLDRAQGFDGL